MSMSRLVWYDDHAVWEARRMLSLWEGDIVQKGASDEWSDFRCVDYLHEDGYEWDGHDWKRVRESKYE